MQWAIDPLISSRHRAAVTGIPSLRLASTSQGFFTQSIDRLVDALRGETYTLLVVAEPIPDPSVVEMLNKVLDLSAEMHDLVSKSLTYSRSKSEQRSESLGENTSFQIGGGQVLSMIFGISYNQGWSHQTSISEGTTVGGSVMEERINKTAQFCEESLDHFVERIKDGRSLGFWNVGVYLASDDPNTYLRLQSMTRSLFSGDETHFEPLRIVDLSHPPAKILQALTSLRNPRFQHLMNPALPGREFTHPMGMEFQSLGTPLTTSELGVLVNLPIREVPGLKMKVVSDFNLNPPASEGPEIGTLLYRGEDLPQRIKITPKSLSRHTFVTGLTGSGKTNTCLSLLDNCYRSFGLKFLVIDPAKTEYRFLLNSPSLGEDLMVYTLGDEQNAPFRLNPFEFRPGFPLLTHIDLIKSVFNAVFPMYASMPFLLEEALFEIYTDRGWNLAHSDNRYIDVDNGEDYSAYLPRLSDLYAKIDDVVARKKYGSQIGQDLTAALKARISSLLHGNKGLMLDTPRSVNFEDLLNQPVVLELRGIGDDDEKAFLMALVFIMLYECSQKRGVGGDIQHVTLIEEAHRLLRNVPTSMSAELANPRGKTVEMFTDMMAEMRAHGEGFIIVDQMPSKLVPDVVKGSNLKIIHRLLAEDDRLATGRAMGLKDDQIAFLPSLEQGQAVMHSEEMEDACLVRIDLVEDLLAKKSSEEDLIKRMQDRSKMFYEGHTDLLRRFATCSICDAPCSYRPEDLVPDAAALFAGRDYLLAALWGGQGVMEQSLVRMQKSMSDLLCQRFPKGFTPGHLHCAQAQVAMKAPALLFEMFPQARGWENMLALQNVLVGALGESESPKKIQTVLRQRVALVPLKARAGCRWCSCQCWFEFLYTPEHSLVRWLKHFIAESPEKKSQISPEKLVKVVAEQKQRQVELQYVPGSGILPAHPGHQ